MPRKFLLGILLALILLGISRVEMDVDILELLPPELPEVQGLQGFLKHFSKDDEIIVTLETTDPETFDAHLASLQAHFDDVEPSLGRCLSEDLWSSAPNEGSGEILAWLLLNATQPSAFGQIIQSLAPDARGAVLEDSLDTIASSMEFDEALTLAYDPYQLVQRFRREHETLISSGSDFTSDDGSMRLLYLQAPPGSNSDYQSTIQWVDAVKAEAASWRQALPDRSTVQLGFTGEPVFRAEISASMQNDMKLSGAMALLLTSLIFAVAYRRLRPLLALIAGLTSTFALTLGLAGWTLDSMTVMSVGFASILIGLTVDYGVIIYQASLEGESSSPALLRRRTRRSITWAALTTATAFAALGLSVVPGIATLGQLVAIGIIVGSIVMLWLLPSLVHKMPARPNERASAWPGRRALSWPVAAVIAFLCATPIWRGLPALDTSTEALRPRNSDAYETMDRLESKLTSQSSTQLALLTLSPQPLEQLDAWEKRLAALPGTRLLPRALVPDPARQQTNLDQLIPGRHLDIGALELAADGAGFEPQALELTGDVIRHWSAWVESGVIPARPESPVARRFWSRLLALEPETEAPSHLLLSFTPQDHQSEVFWETIAREPDSLPISWPGITKQLNARVPADLQTVGLGLGIAVILMLGLTFRRWQEVVLSLGVTTLTLLALCGAMHWAGWEWNFFSLGAVLLTFGAGLDYSIHILLDRQRHQGDLRKLRRGVIRALSVCSLSTIAGFASISWASNQGLASLGRVCALALALNALVALVLLPWLLEQMQKRHLL